MEKIEVEIDINFFDINIDKNQNYAVFNMYNTIS